MGALSNSTPLGRNPRMIRPERVELRAIAQSKSRDEARFLGRLIGLRNRYSRGVDEAYQAGLQDPGVRARYRTRVQMLSLCSIHTIVETLTYWAKQEQWSQRYESDVIPFQENPSLVLNEMLVAARYIRRFCPTDLDGIISWLLWTPEANESLAAYLEKRKWQKQLLSPLPPSALSSHGGSIPSLVILPAQSRSPDWQLFT